LDLEAVRHDGAPVLLEDGVLVTPGPPAPLHLLVHEPQRSCFVPGTVVLGVTEEPARAERGGEHGRAEPHGHQSSRLRPAGAGILRAAEARRGEAHERTGTLHPYPHLRSRGGEGVPGLDPHGASSAHGLVGPPYGRTARYGSATHTENMHRLANHLWQTTTVTLIWTEIMAGRSHDPRPTGHTHRRPRRGLPRLVRIVVPALLILVWLLGAAVGGPYFGRVDEVSSNDATAYLPDSAEATEVSHLAPEFTGSDEIPAIIVITSPEPLDDDAMEQITAALESLSSVDGVG